MYPFECRVPKNSKEREKKASSVNSAKKQRKTIEWERLEISKKIRDAFLVAQRLKRLPAMWKTRVRSLGWEDPLEKEMATHSGILAWRIPWMEEPGGLQSTGSQRVRHVQQWYGRNRSRRY